MAKKAKPLDARTSVASSEIVKAVAERISKGAETAETELLMALHELLLVRAPYSPLLEEKPESVVEVLSFGLKVLSERREKVHVVVSSLEDGRYLLATTCPDVPFLLSSLIQHLRQRNIHFQVLGHPILSVERKQRKLVSILPYTDTEDRESLILVELKFMADDQVEELKADISSILSKAQSAAVGLPKILSRLKEVSRHKDMERFRAMISWLQAETFNFFGYRCLEMTPQGDIHSVEPAYGYLPEEGCPGDVVELKKVPRPLRSWLNREDDILIEQTPWPSLIYRDEPLVYLGLRENFPGGGWREHGFFGLFTSLSVDEPSVDVPYLKDKIEAAFETLNIPVGSYDRRLSLNILNTFPKVELFLMSDDDLCRVIHSFLSLQRRDSVRVMTAQHLSLEGLALLVVMPKEFFNSDNRRRLENYLCRAFHSETADFRRVHVYGEFFSILVRLNPRKRIRQVDTDALENVLTRLLLSWETKLRLALERLCGVSRGQKLWRIYQNAFEIEYRRMVHPRYAARDIVALDRLAQTRRSCFDMWGPRPGSQEYLLQFYSCKQSFLNELMPLLENLGLCVVEEVDFRVEIENCEAYLKSFVLLDQGAPYDLGTMRTKILDTLDALWHGQVENDYLHLLQLQTGLDWHQVDVFRGYRNYYFQLGSTFSKKRVAFALITNPRVARLLYDYFEARFEDRDEWKDPAVREEQALMPLRLQLIEALEQVSDVNEDRILRTFFNLIDSTVRTNFFTRRYREDYFFSFKISAIGIIEMPFPRPQYEIYVHSSKMEGIHLRGGLVARGGIRWSDRPDDFRTEVLGLMKTQMTKNTVIVPVGSKGGFVTKTPYSTREEGATLSRDAYITLMRGLLDLTDNRSEGEIRHPSHLVCYDGEDPYLVVAADKGTAHLPDTANAVSIEYGFWLGDAFASGGSQGYDHKKLGITARGAWESVKRHFRELGKDIQNEPFTVIGIGDMSGDVFGNGMLLSRHIRLKAAFNHRHIFIDPDPDPETSYQERQRLFNTPRTGWDDYNPELISKGGGVWSRSSKDIPLTPEVRDWLGVRHASIDGDGLVRLILQAEAELLWNGGIGTYVKASGEKNDDVGDRANDAVRVDATALKVSVIGEGGNLGFTQPARIEFALSGGHINTDAIDNSAGVDTSDHEVNLKILMQHLMESELVKNSEQRDDLLEEMTEEVCSMVLRNNYSQSLCLALDEQRCDSSPERFFDLADRLVNAGLLDRSGEFLPTRKEVMAREKVRFTRPELSILLAYTKMHVFHALLESTLPDSDDVQPLLESYFPVAMRQSFRESLLQHPLAREIVATVINNRVVDQAGCSFIHTLARETGAQIVEVVETYLVFERLLDAGNLRETLYALDNRLNAQVQAELLLLLEDGLRSLCRWYLENRDHLTLAQMRDDSLRSQLDTYLKDLPGILPDSELQRISELQERILAAGMPEESAPGYLGLLHIQDFLPLVIIATKADVDIYSAAVVLMEVRRSFEMTFLSEVLSRVPLRDYWDRVAARDLDRKLDALLFQMVENVLIGHDGNLDAFINRQRRKVSAYRDLCSRLRATTPVNLHPVAVSIHALEEMLSETLTVNKQE